MSSIAAARRMVSIVTAAVVALALTVYLRCAAPTVLYGDSAELQTVALVGGIAHPSGYPTFILLGQLFGRLVPGDPAHRITVMSACFGAGGLVAFALLLAEFGLSTAGVAAGMLLLGACFTYWWAAVHCEVYTLAITLYLLGLWRTLIALRTGTRRDELAAALLLGLTVTGHLTFALPVAFLGLVLALRAAPWAGGSFLRWVGLLLAFCAGLSPYLYLAFVDSRSTATNYLKYTIELSAGQFGLTPKAFDGPWERIPWLILGRESHPYFFLTHPRMLVTNTLETLANVFLFEFGPLALLPFGVGLAWLARGPRLHSLTLASIAALSLGFGISLETGRMLPVFTLPFLLAVAVVVAAGADTLIARFGPRPWRQTAATLALFFALAPIPHLLRVHAYEHPIGPLHWAVAEEGKPSMRTLIPRLDEFRTAREVGEAVLREVPRGAFVAGKWNEIMTLVYLQTIEGKRPDLTLDPFYYPWHLERMRRFQELYDPRERPFVMVGNIAQLRPWFYAADSEVVADSLTLYVQRAPIRIPWPASRPQPAGS